MAGIVGVDPEPLTLRQLMLRSDATQSERWNHTTALQATILSVVSGQSVDPSSLHPMTHRHRPRRKRATAAEQAETLKSLDTFFAARNRN